MNPFDARMGDWVVPSDSDGTVAARLVVGVDFRGFLLFCVGLPLNDCANYRLATAREKEIFFSGHRYQIDSTRQAKGMEPVEWQS